LALPPPIKVDDEGRKARPLAVGRHVAEEFLQRTNVPLAGEMYLATPTERTGNSLAGRAFELLIPEGVTLWADMFIPSLAGFALHHGYNVSCGLPCSLSYSERSAEPQA
jgi:hypothetical protein